MNIKPTQSGGRIAQGKTPWGDLFMEVDEDENIIGTPYLTVKTPEAAKPQGVGDTVKKITDAAGITQCPKCPKRQATLNKWLPYNRIRRIWNCLKG